MVNAEIEKINKLHQKNFYMQLLNKYQLIKKNLLKIFNSKNEYLKKEIDKKRMLKIIFLIQY